MYVPGGEAAPNQCAGGTAGEVLNPGGNTIGGAPGTGTWIVCGPPWGAELDCLLGV